MQRKGLAATTLPAEFLPLRQKQFDTWLLRMPLVRDGCIQVIMIKGLNCPELLLGYHNDAGSINP